MDKQDEKKLLSMLKSIDGTLKHIEQLLSAEKQHEIIRKAVSHAMSGEKNNSTPKDDGEYLTKAVRTAIRGTFQ